MSLIQKTICDLVREAEEMDKNGTTLSSKYVMINMREDIDRTEAYINSKHTSGDTDYMGREKPFFNICIGHRNIWFRATDIDSKSLVFRADNETQVIPSFLATILLQQWIKKVNFGKFLNTWGLSLATHGSSILKFVEKEGELSCEVMDWNNMIVDAIDFDSNIKIQKLWFTPAQLKMQKGYDQKMVDQLLDNPQIRETLAGEQKDTRANYIEVFEVHGNLPLSLLTDDEEDDDTFVQQMHVISFKARKETGNAYDDYTLYRGKEKRDPFMITHLIQKDGITYTGGAVKNLFEAQWMVNDSIKREKDQLELASKIIFQTSDSSFSGSNALLNIENGEVLTHKVNEPITQLNNKPDIASIQSFKAEWMSGANQINGINEAMVETPKAGTAWRSLQAQLQEAHSLFELMTENKGLYIKEMFNKYIIPFFEKQLDTTDEIAGVLEEHQIKQFDSMYVPNEVQRRLQKKKIDTVLSGEIYDPMLEGQDASQITAQVEKDLLGNQRFIKPSEIGEKTWKDIIGKLGTLDIDPTQESKDVQAVQATLQTALQFLLGKQGQPMTDDEKLVFSRLLSSTGLISPIEMSFNQSKPMAQMPQMATGTPMPQFTNNQ